MLHVITPLRSLYAYINKKCLKKCAPKYKENIQRVSDKDRTKEGGGGKGEGGRGRGEEGERKQSNTLSST